MTRLLTITIGTSLVFAAAALPASSADINTGGSSGAYHSTFCPNLAKQLNRVGTPSKCLTSEGTVENLNRVRRDPTAIGFGQLDAIALETETRNSYNDFELIRTDDARECVFAVTRNKNYTNFGELAVNADRLRFVLPPQSSGSASTFDYLRKIDPTGLGRARNVVHANDTDEAIELALADENGVTFFVQFPDPSNKRFRRIRELKGHIVPVVDSLILDQKIDGQTVYYAQETSISQLKWLNLGRRVVTVCTPLVIFTGSSKRIEEENLSEQQSANHRQLVLNVRAIKADELVPEQSPIAKIVKRTKELSRRARYHFQEMSSNARERARPFFDRLYRGAGHWVRVMILKARPPGSRDSDGLDRSDNDNWN